MKIIVDKERCTGCGECKKICPKGEIIWKIDGTAAAANLRYCLLCILCASECPEGAIKILRDGEDEKGKEIKKKNQ